MSDRPEEPGTYQVWHDRRDAVTRLTGLADGKSPPFPGGYDLVGRCCTKGSEVM